MYKIYSSSLIALLLLLIIVGCSKVDGDEVISGPLFATVSSSESNITFANKLTPHVSTKFNLLDFDYYYNGAGVGVGDINNDGLPDIFFAANEVENQLYLNKGELVFEDISDRAHINVNKHWSNGVSMVDINQDGWLDIYVSQGGPHETEERHNLLYINNKDLTFTESAAKYGLDDSGISTQSAFFDFDHDGDLDCIVANESLLYGFDPSSFHRLLLENPDQVYESYSHFYRNDGGKFTDITVEAGITSPTFGLGLVVSDINEDGWEDIYIANDYYQPDNVYINKKNGAFADRAKVHLKQTSFFSMGADIADINNDGHQDIFVLDMASKDHVRAKTLMASMDTKSFDLLVNKFGFLHQYMFNSLQLNDGRGRYDNIAQMSGVANTDWSWASILEDFDNDGYRDIFVTNGYRLYGTDNDFKSSVTAAKEKYKGNVPLEVKQELYESMPTEPLANKMFENGGDLKFEEVGEKWGLGAATYSNGAATADLDNDGDLDLVINNMDAVASIYENTADRRSNNYLNVAVGGANAAYTTVEIEYNGLRQIAEVKTVRGYMSSLQPLAHFGLGDVTKIDKLIVTFADGSTWEDKYVSVNQTIQINSDRGKEKTQSSDKVNAKIKPLPPSAIGLDYTHKDNTYDDYQTEILLPYKQSTRGSVFAKADLNGDNIDDIYIGSPSGQAGILHISNEKGYIKQRISVFDQDAQYEDAAAAFFDFNNDAHQDLIVLSGGNEFRQGDARYHPRLYLNDGQHNFTRANSSDMSAFAGMGGAIQAIDYDQDGDDDILIGNRVVPQRYPEAAASYLLRNDGGVLVDVTAEVIPQLSEAGIINDISVIDYDNDGDLDISIASEWEAPIIFKNASGSFTKLAGDFDELTGMYFSVTPTDINGDGRVDFVFGNIGENYKLSASQEKPLRVYAGDFDKNGTHDLVLTKTYKGEYVPVRGRECSSQQMPFILDKFETYDEFANSSLIDIYGDDELDNAYTKSITTRSSYVLINQGDDNFTPRILPNQAQIFPLLAVHSADINHDGNEDLICMGSIYDMEVETPRLDAGTGLILISDGENYTIDRTGAYDLHVAGEIKSSVAIRGPQAKEYLIIGRNNSTLGLIGL